ncbi:MmgE/PrpD family protein [Antarctobacter sp.]|uniref:MmgE/PrpD family protein n=1 Tax=Antarctobacter sp. TaxID=1872577 RepID=UPI003A90CE67
MTIVEDLAAFTTRTDYKDLPADVADESKRLLLDSIGCALAAVDHPKGKIGVDIGRSFGGSAQEAVVLGTGARSSVLGACFANGELINALDMDAILPPGHVAPYVIPAALALAEKHGTSGADMVVANALAHEISNRIGKAMDYLRDIRNGQIDPPTVYGYSSTIFGGTAAALKVKGASAEVIAHSLGIAGCTVPVNSHMAWVNHAPSTTVKYTVGGVMAQAALTAAMLGEGGHRGDLQVLDDPEYGFAKMIGTKRWEPAPITDKLGEVWGFVAQSSIKPYPYCRVLHAAFDIMARLQGEHDIKPEEIETIKVQGEGFLERPLWQSTEIGHVIDAQFSLAHGIALAAHRVQPGKQWQDPKLVYSDSVMKLMERVSHEEHPAYISSMMKNPASRATHVEIFARGRKFSGDQLYPKGSPSPDPASRMTTGELVEKFQHNGAEVLSAAALDDAVDAIMNFEQHNSVARVMAIFVEGAKVQAAA